MIEAKVPESFSGLAMYGNREIFERRLREGYINVAFGSGEWVGDSRIVRLWVFYGSSGEIATYEHPKADQEGGMRHGQPFEATYSAIAFRSYVEKWRITLGPKMGLAELLKIWAK